MYRIWLALLLLTGCGANPVDDKVDPELGSDTAASANDENSEVREPESSEHDSGSWDGRPQPKMSVPATQPIELRLNLTKGDSKTIRIVSEGDINLKSGDESFDVNTSMLGEYRLDVLDVDARGIHTVNATLVRSIMEMSGGPQPFHFDSADSANSDAPIGKAMAAVVDVPFSMTLTPQGKVEANELMAPLAQQYVEGMFIATFLPDRPIKNGDTWTARWSQGTGEFQVIVDATCTLLGGENGDAIIGVNGKNSGVFSGTTTGTVAINVRTGWITNGTLKIVASGKYGDMDGTTTFVGK